MWVSTDPYYPVFSHILCSVIFPQLSGGKSTGPSELNFLNISPLKSLNLILIPSAELGGHRGTWTGCLNGLGC